MKLIARKGLPGLAAAGSVFRDAVNYGVANKILSKLGGGSLNTLYTNYAVVLDRLDTEYKQ